jgi:predicted flap endonuclease-1-like 5' DNA nuclease/chromosome segregation ATPase
MNLFFTPNPWTWLGIAFLAGALGWLLHWLFERVFWRKRQNCCDEIEAKLREREAELSSVNARLASIESNTLNFTTRENDLQAEVKSKGVELAAAVAGGVALQKTIDALTGDKRNAEKENADLRLRLEKAEAEAKLATEAKVKSEGDLRSKIGELAAAAAGGAALKGTLDALSGDKKNLEAELANAKAQISRLQADLKLSNDGRVKIENDLKMTTDSRVKAEGDLKTKLAELAAAAAGGAALKGTIDALTGDKGKLEKELADARAQISRMQADLNTAKITSDELAQARTRISTLEADLNMSRDAKVKVEGDYRAKAAELAAAAAGGATLKASIDALTGDKGRLEKELANLREMNAKLETDVKAAKDSSMRSEAMLRTRDSELINAQSRIGALQNDLNRVRAEAESAKAESAKLHAQSGGDVLGKLGAAAAGAVAGAAITSSGKTDTAKPAMSTLAIAAQNAKSTAMTNLPAGATVLSVACPQDLSEVHGIGRVFETRLFTAGIGTFWEVANMSDADLKSILEVTADMVGSINYNEIRTDAARLARESNTVGRTWSGSPPDDFEPYAGIGRVYENRLYSAGICTHEALANTPIARLKEIILGDKDVPNPPDFQSWIDQARKKMAR